MSEANPTGRPTKFDPEYVEQAYKLALLGATDKQIADFFDVTEKTLNNWKHEYPDFLQSLKAGKLSADGKVASSLFHRANGYSHPAVKIHWDKDGTEYRADFTERYPPDTTAAIFWLKNRQPALWRDKTENTHQLVDEDQQPVSLQDIGRRIAFAFARAEAGPGADAPSPIKH